MLDYFTDLDYLIERAREVQAALYEKYRGESHTLTNLWAIGRWCC